MYFFNLKVGLFFSFKKFGVVFLVQSYTQFQFDVVFFCMILLQKLPAHFPGLRQ